MMMCIGGVSDFEAQMVEPPFGHASSGDYVELKTRSIAWEEARRCDAHGNCFGMPTEPSRPYSHGRRFIPARLAAERERCMAKDCGTVLYLRDGYVVLNENTGSCND
jgi:hypothetical protein